MNKFIGAHVSASGGVHKTLENAKKIEARAFAFFVKNQRQWNAKPLEDSIVLEFKNRLIKSNISVDHILPHAGYLINLGSPFPEKREKSISSFIDELERCSRLGMTYLNIHPGSHLREISEEASLDLVVDSLEQALDAVPDIKIIIENTAGQGSNLGYKFEHLAHIINKLTDKNRIGVCLDTCHTYAAGYDIKDPEKYEETMSGFGDIVGFEYLTGIHLNDSKVACCSRKDRHHSIGKGYLELPFFVRFMNDDRFDNMPIILETIDDTIWLDEIKLLYNMIRSN